MKPFVSVLIPAHNAEPWIADAIRSALGQTWSRREIIVVDDGSTDATMAVAEQFSNQGVRVVTQTNSGASAARNTAIRLSQGDYIQWLDADDLLEPDKIATQIEALASCSSKRTLLSGAWGHFYYRTSKAEFSPSPLWHDLTPVDWLLTKMGQNHHMQPATWLVSRELTEAAGPWDTRLWRDNDGEYFCRVVLASDGIRFVPDAKVYYRRSGFNCITHIGRSNRKLESLYLSMVMHVEYLRSLEDSPRVRAACLSYLQNWLVYFCVDRPDLVEQLQGLAATLGGRLTAPRLAWKYAAVQQVLGRTTAHRCWTYAPMIKQSALRSWDRTLYRLEQVRREDHQQSARAYEKRNWPLAGMPAHSLKLSSVLAAMLKIVNDFWA
jgi:glycosyltransferase involved in cell wall biosynthesis